MSDSHLGFQDLNKVDEKGRNIIEERIYSGFIDTIDQIIKQKPEKYYRRADIFRLY